MSTALLVRAREKGPVFFPDREYGEWIASAITTLDQIAASVNVPTIDSFTYMDPDILQEMMEMVSGEKAEKMAKRLSDQRDWHSPADGQKTIDALITAIKANSTPIQVQTGKHVRDVRDAVIEDLEVVSKILSDLLKSDDSFRFEAA